MPWSSGGPFNAGARTVIASTSGRRSVLPYPYEDKQIGPQPPYIAIVYWNAYADAQNSKDAVTSPPSRQPPSGIFNGGCRDGGGWPDLFKFG